MSGAAPLLLGSLALVGCVGTPPRVPEGVPAARAVAVFADVCVPTLPDFAGAPERARAAGLAASGPASFLLEDGESVVRVGLASDGEPLCAVSFVTRDRPAEADVAFARLVRFRSTVTGERVGRINGVVAHVAGPVPARASLGADGPARYELQLRPEA